jgi:hypothetical protein
MDLPPLAQAEVDGAGMMTTVEMALVNRDRVRYMAALERIEARMIEWERACRRVGVWRDSDADAMMCRWVATEARTALKPWP